MQAADGLSDAQAAVYDRQLRLWGHEVQRRLMTAKVLVIGGDGLAAEIAKNLVLAGVGHVSLADDTPVSQAAFGNFLVTSDASDPTTVAQASVQTLSAMNPLMSCTVTSLGGPCTSQQPLNLQPEQIAPFDLIISTCGLSCASADRLEQLCADTGKQLYIAEVVGPLAYAFMYLGPKFTCAEKQEAGAEGPSKAPELKESSYARLAPSLSRAVNKCIGRRPTHPLYQVLRVVRQYEAAHGMVPTGAADLPALLALAAGLESTEGAPSGSISTELLDSWVLDREVVPHVAAAPVAAVAGGALANSALRAISRVGAPLKNWFFFTLHDGSGMVEDIGDA